MNLCGAQSPGVRSLDEVSLLNLQLPFNRSLTFVLKLLPPFLTAAKRSNELFRGVSMVSRELIVGLCGCEWEDGTEEQSQPRHRSLRRSYQLKGLRHLP